MRNLVCLIAVLALTASAFAGSLTVAGDVSGGVLTVTYSGDNPVGVGIIVDMGDGTVDSFVAADSFFDVFIDDAADNGVTTLPVGTTPVAKQGSAGIQALPAAVVAICEGNLEAAAPTATDVVIAQLGVTCGTGDITISLDPLRGGIVDAAGAMTTNLDAASLTVTCSSDPTCWSAPCFAYGDVNGDGNLTYTGDVQPLIDAWNAGTYDPCVDFNKDGYITYTGDVQVLINNWATGCP